jgi:hypothetical protein
MKQTAVEWLSQQVSEIIGTTPLSQKQEEKLINTINKALEMEKQQIIEAFIGHDSDTEDNLEVAEQYYNETFKQ